MGKPRGERERVTERGVGGLAKSKEQMRPGLRRKVIEERLVTERKEEAKQVCSRKHMQWTAPMQETRPRCKINNEDSRTKAVVETGRQADKGFKCSSSWQMGYSGPAATRSRPDTLVQKCRRQFQCSGSGSTTAGGGERCKAIRRQSR